MRQRAAAQMVAAATMAAARVRQQEGFVLATVRVASHP